MFLTKPNCYGWSSNRQKQNKTFSKNRGKPKPSWAFVEKRFCKPIAILWLPVCETCWSIYNHKYPFTGGTSMMLQKLPPTCFHIFLVIHKNRKIGAIHLSCDLDLLSPWPVKISPLTILEIICIFGGQKLLVWRDPADWDEFFVCVYLMTREKDSRKKQNLGNSGPPPLR